ncbi:MAG TPA: hypothetical protein VNA12_09105 [Mycobacteriales bacterium]|nr:hypothetical protein [Mycobacteriales bacterium]
MTGSRAGMIGFYTGLAGAASALVLILWPRQGDPGTVMYPFTETGFVVAQAWFAVHHIGLVLLLIGLARQAGIGGRVSHAGAWLAVAGMVGLSFAEVFAMRYGGWQNDAATAMGAAYGITVNAIGLGLVAAGLGTVRASTWTGWHRWMPLTGGVAVFAIVTPGMFGGFVVGRLAIGTWMLMLAALGWGLHAEARTRESGGGGTAVRSPMTLQEA